MELRKLPALVAKLPRAMVEQRREVRGLAATIPKIDARLQTIEQQMLAKDRTLPLTADIEFVRAQEGLFLIHTNDVAISHTIRATGVWASQDLPLFRSLIRSGDRVVDVGANLGHHSVVFSKLAGPSGGVLAIEPQTLMFRLLNANLVLNGCTNVTAERCAAGERCETVKLWPIDYSVASNYGALGVGRQDGVLVVEHDGEMVQVDRIDDILARLNWQQVNFLKVDVQTYELYVLQGAEATLRSKRPVMFVEVAPYWMRRTGYDYREIYQFLQRLDYTIFEPHRSLVDAAPLREWSGDEDDAWDLLGVPCERLDSLPWRAHQALHGA